MIASKLTYEVNLFVAERSEALSGRLSKSASELSCAPPGSSSPPRARSAHHAPLSVVHRTQHFFTNLKTRWQRSRSKERCPAGTALSLAPDSSGTEYCESSESTPANSPRHRGRGRHRGKLVVTQRKIIVI
ncbi:hypothetical protein O0L34_g1901 [Tuta absoluta]|nr:hypothetical protein O0L34_g1901 [Tuta absoluta]